MRFRVSTEVQMHEILPPLLKWRADSTADRTGAICGESFAAIEDERTASLRMLWAASDLPKQLPQEYWLTLPICRRQKQRGSATRLKTARCVACE